MAFRLVNPGAGAAAPVEAQPAAETPPQPATGRFRMKTPSGAAPLLEASEPMAPPQSATPRYRLKLPDPAAPTPTEQRLSISPAPQASEAADWRQFVTPDTEPSWGEVLMGEAKALPLRFKNAALGINASARQLMHEPDGLNKWLRPFSGYQAEAEQFRQALRREPDNGRLREFAHALGVNPEELLADDWRAQLKSHDALIQGFKKRGMAADEGLQAVLSAVRGNEEEIARLRPDVDQWSAKGLTRDILTGAAEMAPAVATTLLTRRPAMGSGVMGTQMYGHSYIDSLNNMELDPEAARQRAALFTVFEFVSEATPLRILLSDTGRLSKIMEAGMAEGLQEGLTQVLQSGYDMLALDQDMTLGEFGEAVAHSMVVGAGVGAGLGAITPGRAEDQPDVEPTDEETAAAADRMRPAEPGKPRTVQTGETVEVEPAPPAPDAAEQSEQQVPPGVDPETGEVRIGAELEREIQEMEADEIPPQMLHRRTNGQPFASERSAKASQVFKDNPGAAVIPVDGGFAVQVSTNPAASAMPAPDGVEQGAGSPGPTPTAQETAGDETTLEPAAVQAAVEDPAEALPPAAAQQQPEQPAAPEVDTRPAAEVVGALLEPGEFQHSRTGAPQYVAKLIQRVDNFSQLSAIARKNGGRYSRFNEDGAVPGFLFKTAEARDKFMEIAGGMQQRAAAAAPQQGLPMDEAPAAAPKAAGSAQFQAYRKWIEEQTPESLGRLPGLLEEIRMDYRVSDSEGDALAESFIHKRDASRAIEAARAASVNLGANRALQDMQGARHVTFDAKDRAYERNAPEGMAQAVEQALTGTNLEFPFPTITVSESVRFGASAGYDKTKNQIYLTTRETEWAPPGNDDPTRMTPTRAVHHEVGHWGFMNALSGQDRLAATAAIRGDLHKELIPGKEGSDYPRAKFDDIDEYVAEMYSNYKRGLPTDDRLTSYFRKIDSALSDADKAAIEEAVAQGESIRARLTPAAVDAEAHEAATSPQNSLPEPTDAQKEAGNYKLGHVKVQGLDISIENPRGSTRSGTDPNGKTWEVEMQHHYGYIKRTDGDHVDVFVGPNPESDSVFVVDQVNQDGTFDEHKVLMGFDTQQDAEAGYLSNYEKGWKLGPVTAMNVEDFRNWLRDGDTSKPLQPSVSAPAKKKATAAEIEEIRKRERAAEREKKKRQVEARRQAARELIGGADVGDIITPSGDVGYAKGSKPMRVESIGTDGAVRVVDPVTGSGTTLSRGELLRAQRDQVQFKREAPTAPAKPGLTPDEQSQIANETPRARPSPATAEAAAEEAVAAQDVDAAAQSDTPVFDHSDLPASAISAGYAHTALGSTRGAVETEQRAYVDFMEGLRTDLLQELGDPDEATREALNHALAKTKAEYIERRLKVLNVRSGVASSAVAGRSKFNQKQSAARGNALDKAEADFARWQKAARAEAERATGVDKVREARAEEQAQRKLEIKRDLATKALQYKPGDKFGSHVVERVSTTKDGYPSKVRVKDPNKLLTDPVFELWRIGFDSQEEFRSFIDQVRPETRAEAQPAAPDPVESAPEVPTSRVAQIRATLDDLRGGTVRLQEYRAAFDLLTSHPELVTTELAAMTKDALLDMLNPYSRGRLKSERKAEVVAATYRALRESFALGKDYGPNSYVLATGAAQRHEEAKLAALRELVEAHTEADLAAYANEIQQAREEAAARRTERLESLQNPQSLEDFQNFMALHQREGKTRTEARALLTTEQRVAFDALQAESSWAARKGSSRSDTPIQAAGQKVDAEIISTTHTQKGHDLFVVRLGERVPREDFNALNSAAKRMGGYYSSFRGAGAVPGFQFKDRDTAQAFVQLANGDATAANEAAESLRDAFADDRSQTAVQRLQEMADRLEERADEALAMERKANTSRRARMAASAEAAARADKAMAKTMRNIAAAIDAGKTKFLVRVRAKTQVELLNSIVESAKSRELQAKHKDYGEQQKRKGQPPTVDTVEFAEFPSYTMFRSDLAMLAREMSELEGAKRLVTRLGKIADDVTGRYVEFAKKNLHKVTPFSFKDGQQAKFANREAAEHAIRRSGLVGKAIVLPFGRGQNVIVMSPAEAQGRGVWAGDPDARISLAPELGDEIVEKLGKAHRRTTSARVPWQLEAAYERRKALARIGIEQPWELRAALHEYVSLREQAAEADRIKELERAMVGRARDGLDFFPTPEAAADAMIQAIGIESDMAVLEPSAGMGHLADRVRAAGAEPDVIEMSSSRRELLEAKGYNLIGQDFLDEEIRAAFTFGDTFRAPDGTEGVMRGAGGWSNRVRLVDDAGLTLGYFNRDELTGVQKNGTASGYDRIVMNPPFSDGRDMQHVRHAYDLLKPGGRLVSLMGESVFFRDTQSARDFRAWLDQVGGTNEKLPEGTFLDPSLPVTTGASARMVVIEKRVPALTQADAAAAESRSTPEPGRHLPVGDVEAVVARQLRRWPSAPSVVVVPNARYLPSRLDAKVEQAGSTVNGLYDRQSRTVYLLAEGIADRAQAERTLAHEVVGHFAFEREFRGNLAGIYADVSRLAKTDARLKPIAAEVANLYPDYTAEQQAAEVVAKLAESGVRHPVLVRLQAGVRRMLRILGFRQPYSLNDVRGMLLRAADSLRTGNREQQEGSGAAASRTAATRAEYEARIDALYAEDAKAAELGVKVLDASDVLAMLGYSATPVHIAEGKVIAGRYNHRLSAEHWKQVPEWLENPVAVFESDTVPGRLVFLAPETVDGSPILVVLQPAAGRQMELHLVVNAYEKERAPLTRWVHDGLLRYQDKKKSLDVGNRYPRLRLPGTSNQNQGPGRVYTERDLKKYRKVAGDIAFSLSEQPDKFDPWQDPPKLAAAIKTAVEKAPTVSTLQRAGWALSNLRPAFLATLTRDQLIDLGTKVLPSMKRYLRIAESMEADRNRLMADSAGLADKWRKFAQKDRAMGQLLSKVMHEATIAGVDPAEQYQPLTTPKETREHMRTIREKARGRSGENTAKFMAELKQAKMRLHQEQNRHKAAPRIYALWDKLSPEAQALYVEVRDAYSTHHERTLEALIERINDSIASKKHRQAAIDALRARFEGAKVEAPYFPLARFGDYWVRVQEGESSSFHMFETVGQQEAFLRKVRDLPGLEVTPGAKVKGQVQSSAVPAAFVAEVDAMLADIGGPTTDKLRDEIYQLYLQSLPDLSVRKHFIHRGKVAGYSEDALRSFSNHMYHGAYQLARLRHAHRLERELADFHEDVKTASNRAARELLEIDVLADPSKAYRLQNVNAIAQSSATRRAAAHYLTELNKRHEWAMNPSRAQWASFLTSIGFVYYLGVTSAAAAVNILQTPMVALPVIGARYGMRSTAAELNKAAKDWLRGRGSIYGVLTGDEADALRLLEQAGTIDRTQAHDLAGLAEQGFEYNSVAHRVMSLTAYLFHRGERFNREVTALAAYRLARKKGMGVNEAVLEAHDLTKESHFNYTNANRARVMQSDAAAVVLLFKQYAQAMIYLLARSLQQSIAGESPAVKREARRKLAGILGMTAVFSGVEGLPWLMDVVALVLETLYDDEDEPWIFEAEFRQFLVDMTGNKNVAAMIARGPVDVLTGATISSRVGLDELWLRESNRDVEGEEAYQHWLEQLVGPVPNALLLGPLRAKELIGQEEYLRAAEAVLPKFAKDGVAAYRYATEGANSMRGDPLVEDMDMADVVTKALGFTPTVLSERYEENNAIKRIEQRILQRRQRLLDRFALAHRQGDEEALDEVKEQMIRYSQTNPSMAIDADTIYQSMQARQKYSDRAADGIVVSPRLRHLLEQIDFAE